MPAPEPDPGTPVFRPVAERGLLVDFAASFSDAAHQAVLRLDRALGDHPFPGLAETIPALVNLLVVFDPLVTDHVKVRAHLQRLLARTEAPPAPGRLHRIDVCYDGDDLAPDLTQVARQTGLSTEAVIERHLSATYEVRLYGFAPGYAYLGGVPPDLRLDRKPAPVRGVPAGSVMIAGPQCLVTTLTMPSGWWVIGRSPAQILTGDPGRPFLFDVGDRLRFHRVPRSTLPGLGGGAAR